VQLLLSLAGNRTDFTGDYQVPKTDLRLGDMAWGLRIAGIGTVHWTFQADDGSMLTMQTKAYHVPEVNQQLLSPQSLLKKVPVSQDGIE
jgi:hypothetical protein